MRRMPTQWLNEEWRASKLVLPREIPSHYVIRLLRECEWEKAARYPDDRRFPWGNDWDPARLNWYQTGLAWTSAVGMFPDGANSAIGACDLVGNVWEWCLTLWAEKYQSPDTENNDVQEGVDLSARSLATMISGRGGRCARGGSWANDSQDYFHAATRIGVDPYTRNNRQGFRICASVPLT